MVQPGLPSRSPLSLMGGSRPTLRASVNESSTCVSLRAGPSTGKPLIVPLGPIISTFEVEANWPGWDRYFFGSSSKPFPNRI